MPRTAMVPNHSTITGPNSRPMAAVPRYWTRNSAIRITTVIGLTQGVKPAPTTSRPSTALSTEIAGVMTPSPYSSVAPKMPMAISRRRLPVPAALQGRTSASRARIPPSPWLSARITTRTYLNAITISNDHTISDSTPSTGTGSAPIGPPAPAVSTATLKA